MFSAVKSPDDTPENNITIIFSVFLENLYQSPKLKLYSKVLIALKFSASKSNFRVATYQQQLSCKQTPDRELNNLHIFVGWASRPSRKDGRDAHPTRTIKKIVSYFIFIPEIYCKCKSYKCKIIASLCHFRT